MARDFPRALLRRTLIAIVLSSVALIVTWGAVQWLALVGQERAGSADPRAKAITQTVSALGAVFGGFAGAWLAGFGRRHFVLHPVRVARWAWAHIFFAARAFTIWNLRSDVFFPGFTSASFYGWLPLYLPELFPTRVRATAQGLSYNLGRVFAGFGALKWAR